MSESGRSRWNIACVPLTILSGPCQGVITSRLLSAVSAPSVVETMMERAGGKLVRGCLKWAIVLVVFTCFRRRGRAHWCSFAGNVLIQNMTVLCIRE